MENLILIDQYLSGSLSDAERGNFEAALSTNDELARDTAFMLNAREAAAEMAREQRKKELLQRLNGQAAPLRVVRPLWRRPMAVAAAAALVLMMGAIFLLPRGGDSPSQLAAQYINAPMANTTTMGAQEAPLQTGVDLFNNKNYAGAKDFFLKYLSSHATDAQATEFLGRTYAALGEHGEAIGTFQMLELADMPLNPAKFYRAVSLLARNGEGDVESAKALLKEVVEKKLGKYKDAEGLLEKL